MKKLIAVAGVFLMLLSSLSGCKSVDAHSSANRKEELIVAQMQDTTTMDPQMQGDMPAMSILINMYDTLVARDAEGNLIPCLATEWEAIDDNVWQFRLREGVKFHNGEPFNADSVKVSLERLINPDTGSPIEEQENLERVEIVDEYTVNLVFSNSDPLVPAKLVMFGGVMLPPKYTMEHDAEYLAKNPIGTGPYKFVSWTKDMEVVMEANSDYWNGAPDFDRLTFRIIPDEASMLAAIRTGEVDIVSGLTTDMADSLKTEDGVKIVSGDWIRTSYIAIDCRQEPLNNKLVRQAMNWAIDKETIIESIFDNAAKQVSTIVPHQNFGYDESITPYGYDPEKAKELLKEAGYPQGFSLKLECSNDDVVYAQAIAGYLEAVGITVELNVVDANTLVADTTAGTADALVYQSNTGWTMDAWNNFYSYLRSDRKYNQGYNHEGLDELIDIEETSLDLQEREKAISEIQNILIDECYFIYLWQRDCVYAVNTNIEYTPNTLDLLKMHDAKLLS